MVRSKRMKRVEKENTIFKYLFLAIIVISIGYLSWKIYVYYCDYAVVKVDIAKIKDVIRIEHEENSSNVSDGYINLYIPGEFERNTNINVSWYDLNYVTLGERDAAIAFMEPDKTFEENIDADEKDLERLEKNNINNGYDLVKYYYENQNKTINIFTSTNKIKLYRMAMMNMSAIQTSDEVYLLEGDVEGILCVGTSSYHTVLYNDTYYYIVDFYNVDDQYFDLDKVIELLGRVSFN